MLGGRVRRLASTVGMATVRGFSAGFAGQGQAQGRGRAQGQAQAQGQAKAQAQGQAKAQGQGQGQGQGRSNPADLRQKPNLGQTLGLHLSGAAGWP